MGRPLTGPEQQTEFVADRFDIANAPVTGWIATHLIQQIGRHHSVRANGSTWSRVSGAKCRSGSAFPAGLHEGRGAALAHQEHAAGDVADQRGDDADDILNHSPTLSAQ